MKKLIFTFVAMQLVFVAGDSWAAADGAGAGMNDCSEFIDLYENGDAALREDLLLGVGQWAIGYMTGLNARVEEYERRELGVFDPTTLGDDILVKCYNAPGDMIINVATLMYLAAPAYQPSVS